MSNIEYYEINNLRDASISLETRIDKVQQMIASYEDMYLQATANMNLQRHSMDDGQVKQDVQYTNTETLFKTLKMLYDLEECLINKYNRSKIGSIIQLRDYRIFK